MTKIADRHALPDLTVEAALIADEIEELLLRALKAGVPLERTPCVVEAAFAHFISSRVQPNDETGEGGEPVPHEATLLLSGEIASDLIPHIALAEAGA